MERESNSTSITHLPRAGLYAAVFLTGAFSLATLALSYIGLTQELGSCREANKDIAQTLKDSWPNQPIYLR